MVLCSAVEKMYFFVGDHFVYHHQWQRRICIPLNDLCIPRHIFYSRRVSYSIIIILLKLIEI